MNEAWGKTTEARLIRAAFAFVTLTIALVWVRFVNEHSDVWSNALQAFALSFGTMGAIVVALFFFNLFWAVPSALWGEQANEIGDLQRVIRPKFSVRLHCHGRATRFDYGHILRSPFTGSDQGVIRQSINALALDVTNETANILEDCEAYLSHIQEVNGEHGAFQSMRLAWLPVGGEVSTVSIPSGGYRTVILFQVVGNRVSFSHDQMPVQVAMMIKEEGLYQGTITLTARNTASSFVAFLLQCTKGEPPTISLMRRGFNERDDLVPWASETPIV